MREKDSVSRYFVEAALHGLGNDPERVQAVLTRAGVDLDALRDTDARLDAATFARLWRAIADELDDEFLGLDSHGMPNGSFAMLSRGLIQAVDIGQAIRRCLSGLGLFLRDIRGTLCVRGDHAVITLNSQQSDPSIRSVAEETFLTVVLGLVCWLAGRRVPIERAQFGHPRPAHGDDHLFWGPNLTYGTLPTEIEFASSFLSLPIVQNQTTLREFLRTSPHWLIIRFSNREGLGNEIYRQLKHCCYQQWPTLAEMAGERGMSIASFRRQLQREGFSFQQLKDEVRRNIAFECLRTPGLSIAEIAERAGFQEASAFHRAFRQWTGESPGQYRAKWHSDV
ncbi:AraC family transcriptional regulator [Pseudomonas sp. B1-22]|uniref:AraC family transcriptional regulator n=1 Tax=Pseudomonas sp. B1-22 TaxID=3141456 RepID=UPI003D267439